MPIIEVNGRQRSERTDEERRDLALGLVENLDEDEQAAFVAILGENGADLHSTILEAAYERDPVSPEKFITDEYYLGVAGAKLYPKLRQDFIDIFEGWYSTCIFGGSLGWGKSYLSSYVLLYVIYQMSCLRDPQATYGLSPGTQIELVLVSITKDLVRKRMIQEFTSKMELSSFFKEFLGYKAVPSMLEIRFRRKNILITGGSSVSTSIGGNVFGGMVDEISFMGADKGIDRNGLLVAMDRAESISTNIERRMQSRFQKVGRLPGVLCLISSKERPVAYIEQRIKEAKESGDPTVFIREYCLSGETVIPLLDGTMPTIAELEERYRGSDDSFEVYSFDLKMGCIVPGLATHPRITVRKDIVLKVVLDNGEIVRATPNHPFMMKSGEYKRADELVHGDSLMPLYRRAGELSYSEIKRNAGHKTNKNHKVVCVRSGGVTDVYDLTVEGLNNFAIGAGVFVHNSGWDVKPSEDFSNEMFRVAVGNIRFLSILDPTDDEVERYIDEGLKVIEVPMNFHKDFERNLEGAIRDIAGIETASISPYINRTGMIYAAEQKDLPQPMDADEIVADQGLDIHWSKISRAVNVDLKFGGTEIRWFPLRHPQAIRSAHIDLGQTGDAAGVAIAHVAEWVHVSRRDHSGKGYFEFAPSIETDLILRVLPPPGDEINFGDMRGIIYQFMSHGFQFDFVGYDSFQSVDSRQQFKERGIESEIVSIDRTTTQYDTLKMALYEGRVRLGTPCQCVLEELQGLQRVVIRRKTGLTVKIDHPDRDQNGKLGRKDVSDALAGVVWRLTMRPPEQISAPIMGERVNAPEISNGGARRLQVNVGAGRLPFMRNGRI